MSSLPLLVAWCLGAGAPAKEVSPDVSLLPGKPALPLKLAQGSDLKVWVSYRKDAVVLRVETGGAAEQDAGAAPELSISLHFLGTGPTALGSTYAVTPREVRPADETTPLFAARAVRLSAAKTSGGWTTELALPPAALPRWPARGPLRLELGFNGPPGAVLRLPEDFRASLKAKIPDDVAALERRPGGWAGYGALQLPRWLLGDEDLTPALVEALSTDHPVDPDAVQVPVPRHISAPDGRELVAVIAGQDPYAVEDQCDVSKELRLGFYAMKGKTAIRVLEWSAGNCALGRAASISLDPGGELSIGYSNGGVTTFIWSRDHFEQTQLGRR